MTEASPSLRYQFANYRKRLAWLVSDLCRSQWQQILKLVAIDATASAFFLIWLSGLLLYGRALESNETFLIPYLNIEISPADTEVLPWVALFSLAGMIGGILLYRSELITARITINYHRRCLSRLQEILALPQYQRWPQIYPEEPRQLIARMGSMGLQLTAMAARRLLRMVLPAVILPCALVVLIQVNATLTALLIPLFIGYLIPFYAVNRHAARIHLKFSTLFPENSARLMQMFRSTMDQVGDGESQIRQFEAYLHSPSYTDASQVFHARRMVEDRMSLVNTQLAVIAFFMLFVYATFTVDDGTTISWTAVLAYLVALRFAISAANQVTSSLAAVSRFMPEFEKFAHFVESAEQFAAEPSPVVQLPAKLELRDPASGQVHFLSQSDLCWVLSVRGQGGPESMALALGLETISGADLSNAYLTKAGLEITPAEQWTEKQSGPGFQIVIDSAPSRFLLEPNTIPLTDIDLLVLFDGTSVCEVVSGEQIHANRQRINNWWIEQKQNQSSSSDDTALIT